MKTFPLVAIGLISFLQINPALGIDSDAEVITGAIFRTTARGPGEPKVGLSNSVAPTQGKAVTTEAGTKPGDSENKGNPSKEKENKNAPPPVAEHPSVSSAQLRFNPVAVAGQRSAVGVKHRNEPVKRIHNHHPTLPTSPPPTIPPPPPHHPK